MKAATGTRSYPVLLDRLRKAAARLSVELETAGELEGYPVARLEFGNPAGPRLLIDAGIHGDEPGSCLGLADWLESRAAFWARSIDMTVFPCLNPFGFEHGYRGSRDSADLNRQFDELDAPLTRIVKTSIRERRFALAMDLHEDPDFEEFYLYELTAGPEFIGEKLLAEAVPLARLSDGANVGSLRTSRGLLRPPSDSEAIKARLGWPIAFFHFAHTTGHVITVETPGRLPMGTRTELQRRMLDSACAGLSAQGG